MAWPKVDYLGTTYYKAEGVTLVPVDGSGAAIIMLREDGGVIGGMSAIEKGDPGQPATIDPAINYTELAHDDPTPAGASWTEITPPTESTPGVYRMSLAQHAGEPGAAGVMEWNPVDLSETPLVGQIPVVNATVDGFELAAQKIPEVFYPGAIDSVGSGNAKFTMTTIAIPPRPWARRVRAVGHAVVMGEAPDVRVNLLARLNSETAGNIVGSCVGIAQTERLQFSPGKPIEAGTVADAYDQVAANAAATLWIRTEQQAGMASYTAAAVAATFSAEVLPL